MVLEMWRAWGHPLAFNDSLFLTNPVHRISYSSTQSLAVDVVLPRSIPMAARSSAGDAARAGHDRIANPQSSAPRHLDEIR